MIDLEHALADLADHLDYPSTRTDAGDRAEALRTRLLAPKRSPRARAVLVAAAMVLIVAAGIVAVAPARHAVADWLGIGAVEIRRTETPPPVASTSTSSPGGTSPGGTTLGSARHAVSFTIVTPHASLAGALRAVSVDRRVPGGLVALRYARFTLVEIATDPTQSIPLGKLIGTEAPIQDVTVDGQPGAWIGSVHDIGYLDRSGTFVRDTVRRSGPVLLWERAGVTYRIEGLHSLAAAQSVAETLG